MNHIDPDKEKKAIDIAEKQGIISHSHAALQRVGRALRQPGQAAEFMAVTCRHVGRAVPQPYECCHRCRRDRDDLSCMGCSKYAWRALSEALEEGLLASIAGLYALIAFVHLYGAVS